MHSDLVLKLLRCSPFVASTLESKRTRESSCNRDVADTQRFVIEEIEKCSRLYCI
jgi:hypothetical protein